MNNKLIDIQDMILREMKRLDDEEIMKENATIEIAKSNALTNSATAYIKSINTSLRIKEVAQKNNQTIDALNKELGI